eukprot:g5939.t1
MSSSSSATVRETFYGQCRPVIGHRPRPPPARGFETLQWDKANLFTSKDSFAKFRRSFNRSTYSKNSAHKSQEVKHAVENCSIDFSRSVVFAIVNRHPFLQHKCTGVSCTNAKTLSLSVGEASRRMGSVPSGIGSYSIFVVDTDNSKGIDSCEVTGLGESVEVKIL